MKSPTCPACGGKESVPIVYGYPSMETEEANARNEIRLGGCIGTGADPDRSCKACGFRFFSNTKLQPAIDAEELRQRRWIARMKSGQYMMFDPKTQTAEDIVDVLKRAMTDEES